MRVYLGRDINVHDLHCQSLVRLFSCGNNAAVTGSIHACPGSGDHSPTLLRGVIIAVHHRMRGGGGGGGHSRQ
jgi:hypothetical protein